MRIPKLLVVAVLTMFVSLTPPGMSEEITVKDGSKITGTIIAVNATGFRIKTSYGEVQIPRSDVVSIVFPENQPKVAGAEKGTTSTDAPSAVDDQLDGTRYVNRTAKFTLEVPAGWVMAPELRSKDVVAGLRSPDSAYFLMVTPEKFQGTRKTYQVFAETQYQTSFKEYKKFTESEVALDGRPALRMIWQGKPGGDASGTLLKCAVYIIPYEGSMIRLSFLTLEPLFDESLPNFDKIAATYRSTP
jgi:hypothetical protein